MPDEAQFLNYVFSIDFKELTISLIILAVCAISLYALIQKIQEVTGFETKSMKKKKLMEENIDSLKQDVTVLKQEQLQQRKKSEQCLQRVENSQQQMINAIHNLNNTIQKNEIEDLRWTILDFSNAVMNGRRYDGQAYSHILQIYDSYEEMLKKKDMTNGKVTIAMNLVKERYQLGMRNGFPV